MSKKLTVSKQRMKEMENDILQTRRELKEMPYSVPEGYFESIRRDIPKMVTSAPPAQTGFWAKIAPLASMAAMFLLLVTAGTFLLRKSADESFVTPEDYIVFSENMISEDYDTDEQYASADINAEDIIEYLIYTGISAETIEMSNE